MEQLKMYFLPGTPVPAFALPEGLSVSNFDPDVDVSAWADCLRDGNLIEGRTDGEAYDECIVRIPDVDPRTDIFFLDYKGEHVGTVTAFVWRDDGVGDVHMVGIKKAFRGRGWAKYLLPPAIGHLLGRGAKYLSLTTDEPRKAAIRSYLSAGFLPVLYDYGMEARWQVVLRDFGMEKVDMLYEDAAFYRTLYAEEARPRVKIGVLGAGRGLSVMKYCRFSENAVLTAVCDRDPKCLQDVVNGFGDAVPLYTDFDEFLEKADMDLVVLANNANEHAPFAIRAMEAGKDVLSELLPVQNMAEAVALVECVERTGRKYFYGENCCFMPALRKLQKLMNEGDLGEFQYGEGEYLHNCEPDWQYHSHCSPDHWRNTMSAFFYCTHSLGPLVRLSGRRPVKVTGFEAPYNEKMRSMGAKGAPFAVELVTLDNGAIIKSLHGVGPTKNSLWFAMQGSRGAAETARNLADAGGVNTLYLCADETEGSDDGLNRRVPREDGLWEKAKDFDHGGGDYYLLYNVCESVRGNRQAPVIGVYEALDMFLPGLFAHFSALAGGLPMEIPDLRNKEEREKWRNDRRCTDPKAAGEQLIPANVGGDPVIPSEVFDRLKARLETKK